MKRLLLSVTIAALVVAGSTVHAMTTDDIIQLCKAGFTPDRIARIVDATGLDEPLTASDWARIKREGCDDQLVDALLEVLVPVDEDSQGEETDQGSTGESHHADVNIYLRGGWGWDGGYGAFSYGWNDPFWSVGWNSWDPYWGWAGWGYPNYWYANDWWGYPYRHRFGCGPFFYHSNWYNGGYYASGHYDQRKAYRRGSLRESYYASVKTPQTVQRNLISKAVAVSPRSSSGSYDRPGVARSKTAVASGVRGKTAGTAAGRAYTTRSKAGSSISPSREARRAKGSGTVTEGKTTTGTGRYGTVKAKGTTRTNPASTGSGSGGTYARPRAKSSSSGDAPTPAVRQKGTPPPASTGGGKSGTAKESGSSDGSSNGTPTPRRKG